MINNTYNSNLEIMNLHTTRDVAVILGVEKHIVHQYTKKYESFLGDNVKLHANGKYKLYNDEAVRILKIIRHYVQNGKKSNEIFNFYAQYS